LAEWTLTAATAEPAVALPPGIVQGAPVLQLTRGAGGAGGRAQEHARSFYRGDAFVKKVRLDLGSVSWRLLKPM
jgi:DNA-binding GntR family transcriptional regulator